MVRTMLESLISEKGEGKKKKEFEKENIAKIEKFHKESFFWEYLINFTKSLKVRSYTCSNITMIVVFTLFFNKKMAMGWIL